MFVLAERRLIFNDLIHSSFNLLKYPPIETRLLSQRQ